MTKSISLVKFLLLCFTSCSYSPALLFSDAFLNYPLPACFLYVVLIQHCAFPGHYPHFVPFHFVQYHITWGASLKAKTPLDIPHLHRFHLLPLCPSEYFRSVQQNPQYQTVEHEHSLLKVIPEHPLSYTPHQTHYHLRLLYSLSHVLHPFPTTLKSHTRYTNSLTVSIFFPFHSHSHFLSLPPFLNTITLDFSVFNVSIFLSKYFSNLLISISNSSSLFATTTISSAYANEQNFFLPTTRPPFCSLSSSSSMSAIKTINSVGLSTHPCRTPSLVQNSSVISSPSLTTLLVSAYISLTLSINPFLIPLLAIILHSSPLLTLSNAAFRSTKNAATFPPLLCSSRSITCCSTYTLSIVLLSFLKPACVSGKTSSSSIKLLILLLSTPAYILYAVFNKDIP